MDRFNSKLVEYLAILNRFLAGIFVGAALFKFIDLLLDNSIFAAIFEALSVLGLGLLTCGYIALMLHIAKLLTEIRDRLQK